MSPIRSCARGAKAHQRREHRDAPEVAALNTNMEAACKTGRVAACAWLAEAAWDNEKIRATFETRARSALANGNRAALALAAHAHVDIDRREISDHDPREV